MVLPWHNGRMNQLAWIFPSVLSVVAVGGVRVQHSHIARLEARVAAAGEGVDDTTSAELATLTARRGGAEGGRGQAQ